MPESIGIVGLVKVLYIFIFTGFCSSSTWLVFVEGGSSFSKSFPWIAMRSQHPLGGKSLLADEPQSPKSEKLPPLHPRSQPRAPAAKSKVGDLT